MPLSKDREKNRLKKARLENLSLLPKNKKPKRPSDPKQAKKRLREASNHLATFPNAGPGYLFVAHAIKQYLSGRARTLEAALGLNKQRGVPGWPKDRWRMAKAVHALKKSGTSRSQIQAALQKRGYKDTDWGTIKRTYAEFLRELQADDVWQDILPDILQDDK